MCKMPKFAPGGCFYETISNLEFEPGEMVIPASQIKSFLNTEKGKTMTVSEFYNGCNCCTSLKVKSARTGKVIAHRFDPEKHEKVGKMQICDVWADLIVIDSGFGDYCRPIMCCYALEVADND